jgi:hypothetical protein
MGQLFLRVDKRLLPGSVTGWAIGQFGRYTIVLPFSFFWQVSREFEVDTLACLLTGGEKYPPNKLLYLTHVNNSKWFHKSPS